MGGGQILQVVLSLAVVGFALYLSARVARRRFGSVGEPAMKVISRQSVSRTQNLVVVEADGNRHLIAFTDGGATAIDVWDAPDPVEHASTPPLGKAILAKPSSRTGTQWSGLGSQLSFADVLSSSEKVMQAPRWPWPKSEVSTRPIPASRPGARV